MILPAGIHLTNSGDILDVLTEGVLLQTGWEMSEILLSSVPTCPPPEQILANAQTAIVQTEKYDGRKMHKGKRH